MIAPSPEMGKKWVRVMHVCVCVGVCLMNLTSADITLFLKI